MCHNLGTRFYYDNLLSLMLQKKKLFSLSLKNLHFGLFGLVWLWPVCFLGPTQSQSLKDESWPLPKLSSREATSTININRWITVLLNRAAAVWAGGRTQTSASIGFPRSRSFLNTRPSYHAAPLIWAYYSSEPGHDPQPTSKRTFKS